MVGRTEEVAIQELLPGFRGELCTFQCLTNCPFPERPCPYDDPDMMDDGYDFDPLFEAEFHTQEFEWWRDLHKEKVKPEPKGKHKTRCPRCYSVEVIIREQFLFCNNCGYNEPLMDFPESIRRESKCE